MSILTEYECLDQECYCQKELRRSSKNPITIVRPTGDGVFYCTGCSAHRSREDMSEHIKTHRNWESKNNKC